MKRGRGLGVRIALAAFAVAFVAVALIAAGVLVLSSRLFQDMMLAHGESRGAAQAMRTNIGSSSRTRCVPHE